MKEFITAVEAVEAEDEDLGTPFMVDGVECRAYAPSDGQLAMLVVSISKRSSQHEKIAGIINFFDSTLDEESREYITDRLLDRTDPFGVVQVEEIIEFLIEEWTGRPTKSPSGSTRSQRPGGQKSTRRTPVST